MSSFNNRSIREAAPRSSRWYLWDSAVPGLHVVIYPSGKKTFAVRYRAGGTQRRHKIGPVGPLTTDQARKLARQVLADLAGGSDPSAERARSRERLSLNQAFERFIEEPGKRGERKPRTKGLYRQLFRDHLQPKLGTRKLQAVDRQEVERLKIAISRAIGPVVANRVLSLLSAIFEAAERWGELPSQSNPCCGVERFREQAKERFLRPEEKAALWAVLDEAERQPPGSKLYLSQGAVDCVRLLALTGARESEITTLEWSMVDLSMKRLWLPDSKTGRKMIPLSPQAIAVLDDIADRSRGQLAGLVCPSTRGTQLRNMGRVWSRIRDRARLDGVRLHDLRHTAASDALNAGVPLAIVGAMLGHASPKTTARYAHVADEALRRGVEALGKAHEQALANGARVARLVPAPRK